MRPCPCFSGGLCAESCDVLPSFIDGVVFGLLDPLDIAVLKSLPFLGMIPRVDGDQGLSYYVIGHFLLLVSSPKLLLDFG